MPNIDSLATVSDVALDEFMSAIIDERNRRKMRKNDADELTETLKAIGEHGFNLTLTSRFSEVFFTATELKNGGFYINM